MDASLLGWGVHLDKCTSPGTWLSCIKNADKSSGIESSSGGLQKIPTIYAVPLCSGDGQYYNFILYQGAGEARSASPCVYAVQL